HVDRLAGPVVEVLARADGEDLAPLALLLGAVGQHQTAGCGLRLVDDLDDDLVAQRLQRQLLISHASSTFPDVPVWHSTPASANHPQCYPCPSEAVNYALSSSLCRPG